jgi:WD40 repeat protein
VSEIFQALHWPGGSHSIRGLALSPDGKRLAASALARQYVAVWDTETGKQVARLDHDFPVESVAFTPDGKSVVTFGGTGLGYRWDIEKVVAARKK